ncbi:MAG: NAD(P)H-dependent oxidoreductase [Rudaea sp.]
MPIDVVVLTGSLRKASYSRRLAHALIGLAPPQIQAEVVEIGELAFYNQDLETESPPAAWTAFRDRLRRADAVLFVTPEYNRSMSAVLKNAVDVGSRPIGKSIWSGKPAAVVSSSPGAIGGFAANHHLRQSLAALGVPTMPMEAYLGGIDKLFEAEQTLVPKTQEFATKIMQSFARWIERNAP